MAARHPARDGLPLPGLWQEGHLHQLHESCRSLPFCGEELYHQRADDAPPYFTIFIVGHIVVPLVLIVEKIWHPDMWVHMVIWAPLILGLTLFLMPRVKAAVIGLQWALRMHGFGLESPVKDALD